MEPSKDWELKMFKWFSDLFTLLSSPSQVAQLTTEQVLSMLIAAKNHSEAAILFLETDYVSDFRKNKEVEELLRLLNLDSGPK